MNRFLLSIMVVGTVLPGGCKTRYEDIPPEFPSTISIINEIDPNWQFRSLDGVPATFAQFKGRKLFINYWATWCGPCIAELPHVQELYDSLKSDTTVAFFIISDEDEKTVRSFVAANRYTLPFFLCDKDKPNVFDLSGYPTTFIVNAKGQIVFKKVGSADWSHPTVLSFLRGI